MKHEGTVLKELAGPLELSPVSLRLTFGRLCCPLALPRNFKNVRDCVISTGAGTREKEFFNDGRLLSSFVKLPTSHPQNHRIMRYIYIYRIKDA